MKVFRPLTASILLLTCVIISACFSKRTLPVRSGMAMQVRRASYSFAKTDPQRNQTLQVAWFGSGCHMLELGNQTLLTDPFFLNTCLFDNNQKRAKKVQAMLQNLTAPQAILVNHSHFDHFLDAHTALTAPGWEEAYLYGGWTCHYLIDSWQDHAIEQVKVIPSTGGSKRIRQGLEFSAYRSRHSPHLSCGKVFLDHNLSQRRTTPPSCLSDFPAGETYNFFIRMRATKGPYPRPEFTIFYLAAPADLEKYPASVPEDLPPIDLVIVPAPGQDNVSNFPKKHLTRLRPRHILINHFNHFLTESRDRRLAFLGKDLARPEDLARKIQESVIADSRWNERFEAIHIPSLTEIDSPKSSQRVILIKK